VNATATRRGRERPSASPALTSTCSHSGRGEQREREDDECRVFFARVGRISATDGHQRTEEMNDTPERMAELEKHFETLIAHREQTQPLRGVSVYDCSECRGRGRIRNTVCHACQGRRVVVIQSGRVVKLTSEPLLPPQRQGAANSRQSVIVKRKANGECLLCGSAQLVNESHCEPCRIIALERSQISKGRGHS
jgi:hypothetical protein